MLHSPGSAERGKVEGIRERNRLANLKRSRRKHFAILCGLRGFTGVVDSRQRAEELTEGVSGVKWKACDTRAERMKPEDDERDEIVPCDESRRTAAPIATPCVKTYRC